MKAGSLRNLIYIGRPTEGAADEYGHPSVDVEWTQWHGEAIPQTAREYYRASQVTGDMSMLWRIRQPRSDPVTRQCVIRFGERLFDIVGVTDPDEGGRELLISCRERV